MTAVTAPAVRTADPPAVMRRPVAAVLLALVVSAAASGAPPRAGAQQGQCLASPEAEAIRLINVERAKVGLAPYAIDARLVTAARLHSEDMAARGYFSHTTPEGVTVDQRIRAQGYPASGGETIAGGYGTPAAAVAGWMNSAGHKAILLHTSLRHVGLGVATGGVWGTYWTANFGLSTAAAVPVACAPGAPGKPMLVLSSLAGG